MTKTNGASHADDHEAGTNPHERVSSTDRKWYDQCVEQLRAEVRELHAEVRGALTQFGVADNRIKKIEEHVARVDRLIYGVNGHVPGIVVRIDRMERIFGQMWWLMVTLVGLVGSAVVRMYFG